MIKLSAVLLLAALPAVQAPDTAQSRAGFMAGCWETKQGATVIREFWEVVTPDFLIGTGSTVAGGVVKDFEFQRVESKDGVVAYVAQPGGKPPTRFTLDPKSAAGQAIFANPQNDFPKRVVYGKVGANAMTAFIDNGEGTKKIEFPYTRCK